VRGPGRSRFFIKPKGLLTTNHLVRTLFCVGGASRRSGTAGNSFSPGFNCKLTYINVVRLVKPGGRPIGSCGVSCPLLAVEKSGCSE
jgi:hypothetical protein